MPRNVLKASVLAAMAVAMLATGPAHADTTCQPIDENTSACVSTTGDPTTGSFGVGVNVGPVNVCVVVFAACP